MASKPPGWPLAGRPLAHLGLDACAAATGACGCWRCKDWPGRARTGLVGERQAVTVRGICSGRSAFAVKFKRCATCPRAQPAHLPCLPSSPPPADARAQPSWPGLTSTCSVLRRTPSCACSGQTKPWPSTGARPWLSVASQRSTATRMRTTSSWRCFSAAAASSSGRARRHRRARPRTCRVPRPSASRSAPAGPTPRRP